MTIEQWSSKVREWFRIHRYAGLILPDGWFGRPRDNKHELDRIEATGSGLTVSLDKEKLLLSFCGELAIDDQGLRLIIRNFESLAFRQVEYGDDSKIHHFEYFTGEVVFEDFLTPIEAATDAAASASAAAPWVRVLNLLARVSH